MHELDCALYTQHLFRRATGGEFRPGGLSLTDELIRACDVRPGARLLDLGCGVGSSASHVARHYGLSVFGLEGSADFLHEAAATDDTVTWVLGSASSLPFGEASFDVVLCECILSLFEDPAEVLKEVRRVLLAGGWLAMSDMYLRGAAAGVGGDRLPVGTCLSAARPMDEVLALVDEAGFRVEMCEDRSEALKSFIASLIFTYGSAAQFWDAATGGRGIPSQWLASARPGYFVMAARAQ